MDPGPWGECWGDEQYCPNGVHGLSCPAATDEERDAAAAKIAAEIFDGLDLSDSDNKEVD
jgi:hypothetical protein